MKKFFNDRFLTPLKNLSWWNQVFLLCIPASALLTWVFFSLPVIKANDTVIYAYQMFSPVYIEGLTYNFNGYKEIFACLLLTVIGIDALFQHGRVALFLQTLGSISGLILFSLFALLDVKELNANGIETDFLYGSVFPIIMCFIIVIACVVLSVTTAKEK